jgi:hypothetical protein
LLVRNTVDGHFYEWWTAGTQLRGVDLGIAFSAVASEPAAAAAGAPAGTAPPAAEPGGAAIALPANGASFPPVAPAPLVPADSTSLLVQAMASFGPGEAVDNATAAALSIGGAQLSEIAAPQDQRLNHS